MTRRYPVTVLLCPATIYQHAAREGRGYAPSETARFAVVRDGADDAPWVLVHRNTGARVESLIPALPRKITMTDRLNVCAAFEAATHLDWSHFDNLPATTHETTSPPAFADLAGAQRVAAEMRKIALQVIQ